MLKSYPLSDGICRWGLERQLYLKGGTLKKQKVSLEYELSVHTEET